MEQATLQLADLPGSATSSNNEPTNGAAPVVNQGGGGDDDDSDKGGDEDVPMTFPQRVSRVSNWAKTEKEERRPFAFGELRREEAGRKILASQPATLL